MSPAHPSQLIWAGDGSKALQSHLLSLWSSCLLAEMKCQLCVGVAEAVVVYWQSQTSLLELLHSPATSGTGRPSYEGSCLTDLLCCFAPFCLLFNNFLRMQALKPGQGWENFHACKPSLSPLLQYLARVELAFPEQGECYSAGSSIILFIQQVTVQSSVFFFTCLGGKKWLECFA